VPQHVLPCPHDLALLAPPLKRLPARVLAVPIARKPLRSTLPAAHTHAIPHLASRVRACLALRLLRTSRLRSADARRVLLFERNERRGDLVRGWVQVTRDRRRTAAAVSVAEEEEVDGDVGGGLCCDASGDEVRAEAGVCAQRSEEEGISGGGPVARWRMEERGVRRFGRLARAGGW